MYNRYIAPNIFVLIKISCSAAVARRSFANVFDIDIWNSCIRKSQNIFLADHASIPESCHAYVPKVWRHVRAMAFRMPSFDPDRHELPFFHVVIGRSQTYSGARIAIITVEHRDLSRAQTIFEFVRQTPAPVRAAIDQRGTRYASCYWMQPRGEQVHSAWRVVA